MFTTYFGRKTSKKRRNETLIRLKSLDIENEASKSLIKG